jgi:hypothetical protein
MNIAMDVLHKTLTVSKALLWGTDVGEDFIRKRLEICAKCDKVRVKGKLMRCGICKCKVAESGLVNLARYEETKDYGCKHPQGSKWKKAGLSKRPSN